METISTVDRFACLVPKPLSASNLNPCHYSMTKIFQAPPDVVWSILRQTDLPESCKPYLTPEVVYGTEPVSDSELPPSTYEGKIEIINDEFRFIKLTIMGGKYRLFNFIFKTCLFLTFDKQGRKGTVLSQDFQVDTPKGIKNEDMRQIVIDLIKIRLQNLAQLVAEKHNRVR